LQKGEQFFAIEMLNLTGSHTFLPKKLRFL